MKEYIEMELSVHCMDEIKNVIYNHNNSIVNIKIKIEKGNWVILVEKDDNTIGKYTITYDEPMPRKYDMSSHESSSSMNRKSSDSSGSYKDVDSKDLTFFLDIIKKYSELIDLNSLVHSSAFNRLIIGKTQSSKSSLFWCLVWIQLKILKKKPVVLCLNSKESKQAMIHKEMKDFNILLGSYGVSPLEVVSNLKTMHNNSVPILLGNSRQVKKLKSYIHQHQNNEFIVNVDEADLIFQDNDWENSSKKLQKDIKWLIDMNVPFWLITASPFAIWFSKIMENVQTFVLKPKESYRSLQNEKMKVAYVDKELNMKDHKVLLALYRDKVVPHVESFGENYLKLPIQTIQESPICKSPLSVCVAVLKLRLTVIVVKLVLGIFNFL